MQSLFTVNPLSIRTPVVVKNTNLGNKQFGSHAKAILPNHGSTQMQMSLRPSSSIISQGSKLTYSGANRFTDRSTQMKMSIGQSSSSLNSYGSIPKSNLNVPSSRMTALNQPSMALGSKMRMSSKISMSIIKNRSNASSAQNSKFLDKTTTIKQGAMPNRSSVVLNATTLAPLVPQAPVTTLTPVYEDIITEIQKSVDEASEEIIEMVQKPLPYPVDGLEPVFSRQVLYFYYGKQHSNYVKNINELNAKANGAAAAYCDPQQFDEFSHEIMQDTGKHLNYEFFWESLAPQGKQGGGLWPYPNSGLQNALNISFGSLKNFQEQMNDKTLAIKGSQWVWLAYNNNSRGVEIIITENHERLTESNLVPLLNIGILASAYFTEYENMRSVFNEKIWKVVNWTKVCERYDIAQS